MQTFVVRAFLEVATNTTHQQNSALTSHYTTLLISKTGKEKTFTLKKTFQLNHMALKDFPLLNPL